MAQDCAAIKTQIDNLTAARTRLLSGQQVVVVVDAFRSRVEYKPADVDKLYTEIAKLQAQYDACISGNPVVMTRPLQFIF